MVLSMERWSGKIAVVTGASAGIGASISEELVKNGLKVIGLARRLDRLQDLENKLQGKKGCFHGLKVDIGNTNEITAAFDTIEKQYGPVHILINNAGIAHKNSLIDGDVEQWKKIFDVNVIGLCCATRESIASMRKNNIDGHIVHINSTSGHRIIPSSVTNVYPATKYAVTALTESLRLELSAIGSKIKVSSISPGMTDSEFFEASGWQNFTKGSPPMLKPEDIADAIIYALSTPPHVQAHEVTVKPVGGGP